MRVVECLEELRHPCRDLAGLKTAGLLAGAKPREIISAHEFHRDANIILILIEVEDPCDVWMGQLAAVPRFFFEVLDRLVVTLNEAGQQFERDLLPEHFVRSEPYFTHP